MNTFAIYERTTTFSTPEENDLYLIFKTDATKEEIEKIIDEFGHTRKEDYIIYKVLYRENPDIDAAAPEYAIKIKEIKERLWGNRVGFFIEYMKSKGLLIGIIKKGLEAFRTLNTDPDIHATIDDYYNIQYYRWESDESMQSSGKIFTLGEKRFNHHESVKLSIRNIISEEQKGMKTFLIYPLTSQRNQLCLLFKTNATREQVDAAINDFFSDSRDPESIIHKIMRLEDPYIDFASSDNEWVHRYSELAMEHSHNRADFFIKYLKALGFMVGTIKKGLSACDIEPHSSVTNTIDDYYNTFHRKWESASDMPERSKRYTMKFANLPIQNIHKRQIKEIVRDIIQ